jgi:hypothetical protein
VSIEAYAPVGYWVADLIRVTGRNDFELGRVRVILNHKRKRFRLIQTQCACAQYARASILQWTYQGRLSNLILLPVCQALRSRSEGAVNQDSGLGRDDLLQWQNL